MATSAQPTTISDLRPQPELKPGKGQVQSEPAAEINLGWNERRISTLGGAGLMLLGLSRMSVRGLGLAALGGVLAYRGVTGHCPAYGALGVDTTRRQRPTAPEEYFQRGIHAQASMTIERSKEDLFRFWRDFTNLPRFMKYLESVTVLDEKRSRWVAKAPVGTSVKWDAEIINEEPGTLIAWRSTGDTDDVDNAGSVRFVPAPRDRGTEVRVVIDYIPPAGQAGRWIARLFGHDPQQQIREDLRNFKRIMEAGEIPTIQGQPRGTCGRSQHAVEQS